MPGTFGQDAPNDQDQLAQQEKTLYGGEGGNIRDMKYIRMRIKTLRIEDQALLQKMLDNSFALTVALPLPDIYKNEVSD